MLKNYRRHALLEVSGYWEDILVPEMTVDHPLYRLTERGKTFVCDGMDEVRAFYSDIVDRGANVFGALEEQVAVSDYGIFIEAVFAPEGTYQISHRFAAAWPYRDGRLVGEFVYDDTGSWRFAEVEPSALMTPAEARQVLAPYLEQSPLAEIEDGLRLFPKGTAG